MFHSIQCPKGLWVLHIANLFFNRLLETLYYKGRFEENWVAARCLLWL